MKPMKAYAHATQVDWIGLCIALRELKSVSEKKKQKERRKDVFKKVTGVAHANDANVDGGGGERKSRVRKESGYSTTHDK